MGFPPSFWVLGAVLVGSCMHAPQPLGGCLLALMCGGLDGACSTADVASRDVGRPLW